MKQLFFLLCLLALFSCGQQKPIKSNVAQSNSKFEPLFAQFKDVDIDTLQVYSTQDSTDVMSGLPIDSIGALFFPEDMAQIHFHEPPSLFAIYKFPIDKDRLALLARTPSDYVPSSIKLFIFDKAKDSLTSYIEVGETIGDAGDYMIKNTWIFRDTSSKHLQALVNITQGHDNSVDNPKDTTIKEDEYYSLLDLQKPRIDTIFADKQQLPDKYKAVVRNRKRSGL